MKQMTFAVLLTWFSCMSVAYGQDAAVTPAWLKEKGAKLLTKADLDALLPGSSFQDESDTYQNRYQNKADGSLATSHTPRIGGGAQNPAFSAVGSWRASDQGQYCVDFKTFRGTETKYCMNVWALDKDYYVTFGRADDAKGRKAGFSK